ncbi:MAG: AlpA family phage regulatory protein [Betaproteobacteria bacterium]|nr:MAG: AlpA family phage regulatory protein [Betaproteobacteria bacterium]
MAEQENAVLIRRREVQRRTGLSRTTIYEKIARGEFPPPINLGARSVGWVEAEIQRWVTGRINASRGAAK